ncbi:MAG: valine--tRNA ligase [Candidatus Pacearchaeota archaeon]
MLEKFSKEKEKEIYEKINFFQIEKNKKILLIDTPPPYPSGRPWHIGAAIAYSQMDMIARAARALGFNIYFPIGIDRNGLPVERYVEKLYNISIHEINREEFLELCKKELDKLEEEMIEIMKKIGLSCDFKNYYRTDSPEFRALTQSTFIDLWNKGLIYEDERPNNFCTGCKTTIADSEIKYKNETTSLYYIKFKLDKGDIIIATTRPEYLASCQAIIVNPNDERYKDIIGKTATIPLYNRKIPIIAHSFANPKFGSGAVMVCSYGDYCDVLLFRELNLNEIKIIDENLKLNKNAGFLEGSSIEEARKRIIEELKKNNLILKEEKIDHKVPVCERCNSKIEIIPMKEFYLKQIEFKEKILEISKKIKFFPEFHRNKLIEWIKSINQDWPISRRRYYGTEIPIWYCKNCKKPNLPKADYKTYYRPWKDKPPFKKCKFCKSKEFIGEERIFDTWVDSSITALFISKYKRDKKFFKNSYPVWIRPQGYEIIRTWLFYSLLRCYQLTKKPCFKYVWIHGLGVDKKGRKMSKSLGNVIDPIPILNKNFADAFRLAGVLSANLGYDFRIDIEKIESEEKFLNKLFNIANFVSNFKIDKIEINEIEEIDKSILEKWNNYKKKILKAYKNFNFFYPARLLKDFLWNYFASHYIEIVKQKAYNNNKSTIYTLNKIMSEALILFYPIIPFITYYLYEKLYGKNILNEKFPKIEKIKVKINFDDIVKLNNKIWKWKKEKNLSLKAEIKKLRINKKFKIIKNDIKIFHNVKLLEYGRFSIE